jgi:U4/U6.U5 tri-snRNP component SNU23
MPRKQKLSEGDKAIVAKAGVDNTARRTWDKEEFAAKAAAQEKKDAEDEESPLDAKKRRRLERDPLHQGLIVQRSALRGREFQVDLASRLGKTQVVTNSTPLNQQAGYYCQVCDCILRDSQSYLDHINGKYHNRALGMNMVVERSTADQVRNRLQALKEKTVEHDPDLTVADGFDRAVLQRQEEEEEERRQRAKGKRRKAAQVSDDEEEELDPEMAAMMGFGGFGGSAK